MKVLKFGGASVGEAEGLRNVIEIVKSHVENGHQTAVVVSAFKGTTDQLIELGQAAVIADSSYQPIFNQLSERHLEVVGEFLASDQAAKEKVASLLDELNEILKGVELVKDLSAKTLDFLMSFGERLSATIITEIFKKDFPDCEYLDAREIIVSNSNYGRAEVDYQQTEEKVRKYFSEHTSLQIITGFVASTSKRETTTLGRGGSDYSAALIGAALEVDEIEIWTDVDGVMTADPRKVKKAFSLPSLTYSEMMELAHFGAKVLYPPSLRPAFKKEIPLRIRNTFNPDFPGTIVCKELPPQDYELTGVSSIEDVSLLRLNGASTIGLSEIIARAFSALSEAKVEVLLTTQASSEYAVCVAIRPEDVEKASAVIEQEFSPEISRNAIEKLSIEKECSIVAVVGSYMRNKPGSSGKLFSALGKNGINVAAIAQGSSEINISVVVERKDCKKALNALHDAFFLSDAKTVNVFLVGPGLVGSVLLEQIAEQADVLRGDKDLDIRVVSIANSRKALFDVDGLDLNSWQSLLQNSAEDIDISSFVSKMKELNLPNSVFVDCTASDKVASVYKEVLSSSISIVTPNKRANSSKYQSYLELKKAAEDAHVKYFYETNVGAGLPIIGTLSDLITSGDEILKIEAVLSGTLSYIFNSFTSGKSFSEIVSFAKEKGYTEPDPRDDLSGTDVARKLLILAREMNIGLEEEQVEVESLVPTACQNITDVTEFLAELKKYDDEIGAKLEQAEKESKVLRYIASLEDGVAKVSLQAVDESHPFYALSGSDNIISFVSKRYSDRPLVVKGPGAGTAVTAAGVFADILRVSSYLS